MPLYLTASHSSRIQKPSSLRRNSSSPFNATARTKASKLSNAVGKGLESDEHVQRLDAAGKVLPTISMPEVRDVSTAIHHINASMFCALPDRAGFNSVRIAEVLNFQKNLPRVVTHAHVHALVSASSKVEREMVSSVASGTLRRIKIVGRGNDISGISEVLITALELEKLLRAADLSAPSVDAFLQVLQTSPKAMSFPARLFQTIVVKELMNAGFLVSSSLYGQARMPSSAGSPIAIPSISRAASGTVAAVGGDAAFEHLGGVGTARRSSTGSLTNGASSEVFLSVPNLGPYLRLLSAARAHLVELLGASKYREAPLYLLRERWDGAVDSDSRVSQAQKIRGEFSDITPARTKKWKNFKGLSFNWALEECFGAGLVELFETRSVGLGVRALT